jgi:hypothetical protein
VKYVLKKAGKRIESGTFTVSQDGKTMQGSISGTAIGFPIVSNNRIAG